MPCRCRPPGTLRIATGQIGEGFAIDAGVIEGEDSRNRKVAGRPAVWPEDETILHPAHEYLNELDGSNAMRLIHINAKTVDDSTKMEVWLYR